MDGILISITVCPLCFAESEIYTARGANCLTSFDRSNSITGYKICCGRGTLVKVWHYWLFEIVCVWFLDKVKGGIDRDYGIVLQVERQPVKLSKTAKRHRVIFHYWTRIHYATPRV